MDRWWSTTRKASHRGKPWAAKTSSEFDKHCDRRLREDKTWFDKNKFRLSKVEPDFFVPDCFPLKRGARRLSETSIHQGNHSEILESIKFGQYQLISIGIYNLSLSLGCHPVKQGFPNWITLRRFPIIEDIYQWAQAEIRAFSRVSIYWLNTKCFTNKKAS